MSLWGGRFDGGMSSETWDYTTDESDRRLLEVDIEGSIAHVKMLGSTGILPGDDVDSMISGLESVLAEAIDKTFVFSEADEDVHSAVERRLGELIGEVAGKLHTGRSRNDQVALDMRLYLREAAQKRAAELRNLALLLASRAEPLAEVVIPTFTHMQQAQTTSLGHHLLAYAWMSIRGAERFDDTAKRAARSPLGAGASAGSSLPLDREEVAELLGMDGIVANSLDAVGSRDFVSEYVFCCAQTMVDLSRFAEELILWASKEFDWLSLSDGVSTGSSALPQKRNPDIAELVRGRSAAVIGDVTSILSLQKALPLAYNRDLQEDKRIVFHADDVLASSVRAISTMIAGVEFAPPVPNPETVALDLAEALVLRGVPFREAHGVVGNLVVHAERRGVSLSEISADDLVTVDPRFEIGDLELLDPTRSLEKRRTVGSGNPESVRSQVAEIRQIVS